MNGEEKIIHLLENIQSDVQTLKSDVQTLKVDVEATKIQVTENTEILKALEHGAQVNKAEHDNFTIQLARIEGSVNSVKSEIGDLRTDLQAVEIITSKNWNDIAKIKAVK